MKLKTIGIAMTACALIGAYGCEQKGPAERMDESIDDATAEMRDGIEDTCEKIKDDLGAKDTDCG